jgi:NAD(P)-dependent dehydrogenase (short-subunit alcohol dehydrogenase family)
MSRPQRPEDGIAWVTGASTGIGRATVLALAGRGWRVAASARDAAALGMLAAAAPERIFPFPLDVTDADAVARVIDQIEAQHGPIALAFLNAGVSIHSRAPALDLASMRKIIDVNLLGLFNGLPPLVERMATRGRGQIALCGSVAGYGGLPFAAAYCASKAAVISTAVSLAIECAPLGIFVQCVNPGFVDTPLTRKNDFPMPFLLQPEDAGRRIADGLASRRFEITFPRRLSWFLKAVNLLPYGLYIRLMRFGIGRNRRALPMGRE